jgi:hypothetical protein
MSGHSSALHPSAMRAAPVLSSFSRGSLCVVPSGKIAIAPPRTSSARAAANVSRFCEVE